MGLHPWVGAEAQAGWLCPSGGSWDFPLCKREKICRLVRLFQSEVEHGHREMEAMQAEHSLECARLSGLLQGSHDDARNARAEAELNETDARQLRERLAKTSERFAEMEATTCNLRKSFEQSQVVQQQAIQRVRELQTSLALLREFGHEDFMRMQPQVAAELPLEEEVQHLRAAKQGDNGAEHHAGFEQSNLDLLMSIEIDLGFATRTLFIAPWQTPADFETVVTCFLEDHGVRPVFVDALVQYLTDLETHATTFPVISQARLADIYSGYG